MQRDNDWVFFFAINSENRSISQFVRSPKPAEDSRIQGQSGLRPDSGNTCHLGQPALSRSLGESIRILDIQIDLDV